jgi:hypothetical protein
MLTISIFIPVWFHPGSCKQGLTNCDSVSWDEIKELKDFISEQCLKEERYINNERNGTNRATTSPETCKIP